jgi:hypothetical protein
MTTSQKIKESRHALQKIERTRKEMIRIYETALIEITSNAINLEDAREKAMTALKKANKKSNACAGQILAKCA